MNFLCVDILHSLRWNFRFNCIKYVNPNKLQNAIFMKMTNPDIAQFAQIEQSFGVRIQAVDFTLLVLHGFGFAVGFEIIELA